MKKTRFWVLMYVATIVCVLTLAQLGSRTVTVMVENEPVQRKYCMIIDAGHGGVDGGATSCTGFLESSYNLSISQRLSDLFHLMGWDTRMIRTTDISVYTKGETIAQKKASDLRERVRIVNETPNGILLSIHQNHYPDSKYSGPQVFYSDSQGSRELASKLQESMTGILGVESKRTCKKSKGIYLMEHIQRPGVLIECGFLSNPAEEARLRDSEYQKRLCGVIAVTVMDFLSNT